MGRFDTRGELEEKVRYLWRYTLCNVRQIAENTEVSETTVRKIIDMKRKSS